MPMPEVCAFSIAVSIAFFEPITPKPPSASQAAETGVSRSTLTCGVGLTAPDSKPGA